MGKIKESGRLIISDADGEKLQRRHPWLGEYAVDEQDRVYISPRICGLTDQEAFMMGAFDGVPMVTRKIGIRGNKECLLVPLDWLETLDCAQRQITIDHFQTVRNAIKTAPTVSA